MDVSSGHNYIEPEESRPTGSMEYTSTLCFFLLSLLGLDWLYIHGLHKCCGCARFNSDLYSYATCHPLSFPTCFSVPLSEN